MKTLLAAMVATMFATPAMAQLAPYAGLHLGYDLAQFDNDAGDAAGRTNGQGWVTGLFGGVEYGVTSRLALGAELEASFSGTKGGRWLDSGAALDHFISMPIGLNLNLGYDWNERIRLLVGGGVTRAGIETKTSDDPDVAVKETAMGTSWMVGTQYDLGQRVFVRGQYVLTRLGGVRFLEDDESSLKTTSQVFRVGLGTRF